MSDNEEDYHDEFGGENSYLDGKKNVTIILIDVTTSMFDTPRIFKTCLLATYHVMEQMLLKSYKGNISICLLRDDDIVLTALNSNIVESTKKIHDLIQTPIDTLRSKFERKNPASLRYTLTECIKQFYNLEKVSPYIVVLTNDEDPLKGDQNEKLSAIDVALSFKELNIKLVVLPLKEKFNYDIFYKELLKAANDVPLDIFQEEDEQSYTSVDDLTDILNCIVKDKVSIRRHKFRLSQCNDDEDQSSFWMQMRYFVVNSHLYRNTVFSRSNTNNLKQGFKHARNMHPKQLMALEEGSEPVKFNSDEYMYWQSPYGFQLLDVLSEKQTSLHDTRKRGFVLQFDETEIDTKGVVVFNNLWQYCDTKKRYLLCVLHSPGNKQRPNRVELSADTFLSKPCFIGHFLTNCNQTANDDEEVEEDDKKRAMNNPCLGLVNDMITKMRLEKYPYHWKDYSYELKASNIKAQLLDIEAEEVESSLPAEQEITEQLADNNTELLRLLGTVVGPSASKRARK